MIYGILGIGICLIILSFMMHTENVLSAIIFRCFPFFSGAYLVFYFLMEAGYINIL